MPRIYGSPSYAVGASDEALVHAAANAPITRGQAVAAQAELRRMRRALTRWLHFRGINDAVAAGQAASIPTPLFKRPGAKPVSPAAHALAIRDQRRTGEAELAQKLYQLLSEVFDGQALPSPDLARDPNAAVALAQIAISGKLPGDAATPSAQGLATWVWPVVIIVGAIAFVITTQIRSSAEREAERERYECIQAGKCTDTGFWLKAGAVVFIGWFLWEKAGIGKRVTAIGGKGGG